MEFLSGQVSNRASLSIGRFDRAGQPSVSGGNWPSRAFAISLPGTDDELAASAQAEAEVTSDPISEGSRACMR